MLLHSPLLGPRSWDPLASALGERGHTVAVPDLRPAATKPPYAERWVGLATAAAAHEPSVLVAHSGAGRVVAAVEGNVEAIALVDAGLPGEPAHLAGAPPEFRERIAALAAGTDLLPPWTSWWGDDVLRALVPDDGVRAALVADTPAVAPDLLDERLPAAAAEPRAPVVYLAFTYDAEADEAAARGWPVVRIAGASHLHHLTSPHDVAGAIDALVAEATTR